MLSRPPTQRSRSLHSRGWSCPALRPQVLITHGWLTHFPRELEVHPRAHYRDESETSLTAEASCPGSKAEGSGSSGSVRRQAQQRERPGGRNAAAPERRCGLRVPPSSGRAQGLVLGHPSLTRLPQAPRGSVAPRTSRAGVVLHSHGLRGARFMGHSGTAPLAFGTRFHAGHIFSSKREPASHSLPL